MKKLLLPVLVLFLFGINANAQMLSEDFETVTPEEAVALTDWTNVAEVGTRTWLGKEYDSNKYAQGTAYNSTEENIMWLVTPGIDMDATTSETLSFDVNIGYWTHDALTVHISTDFAGDPTTATWDDVTSNFTIPQEPTGGYGQFASAGTMDISSYDGMIYIAFVYTGDDNAGETTTIQLDNVMVEGSASIGDLGTQTVKIFPNPVYGSMTVNAEAQLVSVEILNVIGQRVMVQEAAGSSAVLNTNELKAGVYFVKTTDINGQTSITKIIKK